MEFTFWRGLRVEVWRLYETLTQHGWKVDTEESNLMVRADTSRDPLRSCFEGART